MSIVTTGAAGLILPASPDFSTNYTRYMPAVPDNLAYLNYLNGQSVLTRNMLYGSAQLGVAGGPPSYQDQYALFGAADFINTGIAQPAGDHTILCVASPSDSDENGFLWGNLQSGLAGNWLYWNSAAAGTDLVRLDWNATYGSSNGIDVMPGPAIGVGAAPRFIACRYSATTLERKMDVIRNGVSEIPLGTDIMAGASSYTDTMASAMSVNSTNAIRLGKQYSLTNGASKIYFAGIWNRCMTDDELVAQYLQTRTALRNRDASLLV